MPTKEPVPIAIVGMGCRYPGGANSPEALFSLLAEGRDTWTEVPPDRFNGAAFYHPDPGACPGTTNQKGGHFLDQHLAAFDPGFFGIPPTEAESMDPIQRVVLEASWEAVENAGIPMNEFRGSDTAVFVAMFGHDFEHSITEDPLALSQYHFTGGGRTMAANRVSYVFDLHGPSVMLDTACSGSLVALNSACQSLCAGEIDMALAGGVGLIFSPDQLAMMSMVPGFLNSEGKCFAFDDRGNGYGRGEGVGVLVLKRLDDAIQEGDNIRAVIRNTGANHDGRTNGITLPNQSAQESLARKLFQGLNFTPSDVHYAEAHGTGTKAGDIRELQAIKTVFCEERDHENPLLVGSAKPNIGHTEAAAGAAGVIKTVMAMEKGLIPQNILLENLKFGLELDRWNIKIPREVISWPSTTTTRRAVVNSFGYGGTNAMAVLESVEPMNRVQVNDEMSVTAVQNRSRLFPFSARSEHSLLQWIGNFKTYLAQNHTVDLDDLSYTLTKCRSTFEWRSCVIAQNLDGLIESLGSKTPAPIKAPLRTGTVFGFTGQGAQWARMGTELIAIETEFSRSIYRSERILNDLGAQWSLVEEFSRDEGSSNLNDSRFGQPASTAIQLALVDLLRSWNVLPVAVVGHSSGEIAAAYAVGAITQRMAIRAAYHRSFLAEASKARSKEMGAMMAVGLGEVDVQECIDKLTASKVVVACINSPSSTTVSGDVSAVSELKQTLDAQGVFTRLLKVDTAYHSHHMERVSADYSKRLEGFESIQIDPSTRFFSTVTADEKKDDFGAAYWVANLVSQVRFSAAVQRLCEEVDQIHLNFIEVGPHKALAGPLRQSLAPLQAEILSHSYIPTLVRAKDSRRSLMETGMNLFKAGGEVDIGVVATLGIVAFPQKPIQDLPTYHWNHSTHHWTESRLSREYRFRRHPHHDLLGSRILTSPDNQPNWRMLVSLNSLPWLKDHVVDNFIVFPAACYMTMAIEAIKQLDLDSRRNLVAKGYRLRNVSFKTALTIPRESAGIELHLTFQPSRTVDAYNFTVYSLSESESWQEACDGTISTTFETEADEVEQGREALLQRSAQVEQLQEAQSTSTKAIQQEALYAQMATKGNEYGPSFAIIDDAQIGKFQSLSNLTIPAVAANMPARFLQPHLIHPTCLDAVIQTAVPLFQQHSQPGSAMPVLISDTFVSAGITNRVGEQLQVVCKLSDVVTTSSLFSVLVFQKDSTGEPYPVLTMEKGELRNIGTSSKMSRTSENSNIFKMQWGLDARSIRPETLDSVTITLQSTQVGMSQMEKAASINSACARYIDLCVKEMKGQESTILQDHRAHLFRWMTGFVNSDAGQALINDSPVSKDALTRLTSNLGVEGEAVDRFGPSLSFILTGKVDPLSLFLEGDLLYRVYHADEYARANRYLAEYAKILTFQRPDLKILEIGAGTGGTTLQLLQLCSPDHETFCSKYTFTDISPGFFDNVRTTTLKDWQHMLTFETLDLEKDPLKQGFEEHEYDFVIAANVVHATRSLAESLGRIRRLLKPGGLLGLVEIVKTTPFASLTFGTLTGWWAGVDEGRTESPLQSTEQWIQLLLEASFSGVDLAVYDLPEPQCRTALLISTAVANNTTPNGYHAPRVQVLNAIPHTHPESGLFENLHDELVAKGFQPAVHNWSNDAVEVSGIYVILDSADHLLLQHSSPDKFARIVSLLTKQANVYWISFANGTDKVVPDNALITGFARTARNENENLKLFTLDIQDPLHHHRHEIFQILADFIASTEAKLVSDELVDSDFMYRKRKMHIQRLVTDRQLMKAVSNNDDDHESVEADFHDDGRIIRAHIEKPGVLTSVAFLEEENTELGADEIEIQSLAWAVNSKDISVALGHTKATETMLGEGAGVVSRVGSNFSSQYKPGDRAAVMMGTPYANQTRANGYLVHHVPNTLSFTDAASIPVAFATAYYGLVDCANMQREQTILIHAASGDVGQAAIMVSNKIGATIFATVDGPEGRRLLVDRYSIPESHIFSSRRIDFVSGVKRLTGGEGVDVVLNLLSGEASQASWECLADLGTFLDGGTDDTSYHTQLDVKATGRGVRFAPVDMAVLAQRRPRYVQDLLRKIFSYFETGDFSPLPVSSLPISDIQKAFRELQHGNKTGKVVLEAGPNSTVNLKIQPLRLKADATYVLVGGLGEVGKRLCRYIQFKGARTVVIFSRRRMSDDAKARMERDMTEETNSVVRIVTCDISRHSHVSRAIAFLRKSLPPIKGVIHSAMLLSDKMVHQMTPEVFRVALESKYHGTRNLFAALDLEKLDFFLMLSSATGLVGSLSQSNYVAGNVYQDMFAHAQASGSMDKVISLDVSWIKDTYPISPERTDFMAKQGCPLVSIESMLPVMDYVMSGRASRDDCHQIAFGIDPQALLDRAQSGTRTAPIFNKLIAITKGQNLATPSQQHIKRSPEDSIANAPTMADAEQLVLEAIQHKVSSLITGDSQDLPLDIPLTNLGLDSLIAIQIRNWIGSSLQAPIQTTDILDASSLRALASLVSQRSSLVSRKAARTEETTSDGKKEEAGAESAHEDAESALPKLPLQTLEASLELLLKSVAGLGNGEQVQRTREAVDAFLSPDGVGRRLHARLEKHANDSNVENWLAETFNKVMWLRERNWHPRQHNFFTTHPLSKFQHSQAERATLISLAAYEYKLSVDAGVAEQDYQNEQPQEMESVHWLFNSNRTPVLGCDRVDRWPGNEYVAAMIHGHMYKIPLREEGGLIVSHERLKAAFQRILQQPPPEVNWATILTTDNRDTWATTRDELIAFSPQNEDFISTIEKSLFSIYLDDESPNTSSERVACFVCDDNSNRWLDKTLSFIVCANGVSATFAENSMVDASTFNGLSRAISAATMEHIEASQSVTAAPSPAGFAYMHFSMPPTQTSRLIELRSQLLSAHGGYELRNDVHTSYGASYLRARKLPPKSVFQLIVQLALRRHFGYSPIAWDVVSLRHFRLGRTDVLNVKTPEVSKFCAAAEDSTVPLEVRRRLFLDAVRSHAQYVALSTRGRGWIMHILALSQRLEPGEYPPALYSDEIYLSMLSRKALTSFLEFDVPEYGGGWPDKEGFFVSPNVSEDGGRFIVVNGGGRTDEFAEHLRKASEVVKEIIEIL